MVAAAVVDMNVTALIRQENPSLCNQEIIMPTDISVERDLKSLRRGLNALQKQAVPQATVRTLNRVAESAKAASARHICGGRKCIKVLE